MARIDLTSFEWRELIFQGKNKEFGAYKMRSESERRHNTAMIIVVVTVVVGLNLPRFINLIKPVQSGIIYDQTIQLSNLDKPEEKNIKPIEPIAPPPAFVKTIRFLPPVIKEDVNVNNEEQIKSQEFLSSSNAVISLMDEVGDPNGKIDKSDWKDKVTGEVETDDVVFQNIEQMPEFPGGEKELLSYVAKNLNYPVVDLENFIEGKVILKFIVAKNGSVDKVEILKSLTSTTDKEAIRVVKSLPKFIPGKQNGMNVAVWYILPISFAITKY